MKNRQEIEISIFKHLKHTTQTSVKAVIDSFIKEVSKSLADGREVNIAGLGKFFPVMRAKRKVRNPRTGEFMIANAMRVVRFKPAKRLRDMVK